MMKDKGKRQELNSVKNLAPGASINLNGSSGIHIQPSGLTRLTV